MLAKKPHHQISPFRVNENGQVMHSFVTLNLVLQSGDISIVKTNGTAILSLSQLIKVDLDFLLFLSNICDVSNVERLLMLW